MKHSILKICGWLCLILLLALNSVRAQDVSSDTLQVLLTDDIYPYAYRTEQELPAGLLVDFWQEVANAAGMQLKLEMIDREAVLERIAQNQFQVIGGLTRTKERERKLFLR